MKDSKTSDVSACIWNRDQCVHPPPTFYGYFGQENIYRISPDLQRFFSSFNWCLNEKKINTKSQFESMNKHVCSKEYNALIFSLDKVTYWGRNYNEQILIKMNEIILFRKKFKKYICTMQHQVFHNKTENNTYMLRTRAL